MAKLGPWQRIIDHGGVAVLLIRHGQTALNAEGRFCGARSDPPLDARGREQAAALAERLAGVSGRVFSSPQLRARETAAGLGAVEILADLRELDQGALEGRRFGPALAEHAEFFSAWKRDPSEVAIPGGGETMAALAERVAGAMAELVAALGSEPRPQTVAVVGHQMAQAAFLCRALARPLRDWPQFELGNASANLLAWDGRSWSLHARNVRGPD